MCIDFYDVLGVAVGLFSIYKFLNVFPLIKTSVVGEIEG